MKVFTETGTFRRMFRAAVVGAASVALLFAGAGAVRPAAASTSFGPPFSYARDLSKCDDGGGTAVCSASSSPSTTGAITTAASLRPVDLVASGRAEGVGGTVAVHQLKSPVRALRFRFVFEGISAAAATDPAIARDLGARAFAAGYVTHDRCTACTAQVATLVADADPFTLEPASVEGGSYTFDVEVRNPAGSVPGGRLRALGYLISDVGMYSGHTNFVSSGTATAEGRLVRVDVEPLAV